MNAETIVGSALKGLVMLGGLGMVGGLVGGLVMERGKQSRKETVRRTIIPEDLLPYDVLVDCFLTLGSVKGCDVKTLKSAAGRCAAIVSIYNKIRAAHPSTVKVGLMTDVVKVHTSFIKYLRDFYRNSDIPRVQQEGAVIPVNKELADAHKVLMETVDGYRHNIHNLVIQKVREGVATRGNPTADRVRADLLNRI